VRIVASLVAMLGLAAVGLVPAAAPSSGDSLLALTTVQGQQLLVRVDPRTLARVDDSAVELPNSAGGRLRSPDGAMLAVADNQKPVLTFVDVRAMKTLSTLKGGQAGSVELAAWPTPSRLLAFSWGCCPVRTDLIVVDPVAGKVVARHAITGSGWPNAALPNGLVYLATPVNAIRPARLVVADADGNRRSVVLDRIRAGTKRRTVHGVQYAEVRWPGLSADPTGRAAYVVAAGGLVAEVDLQTLAVSYHSVQGTRRLARAQKSVNGPMRYAQWIGDGRIAVSGTDAKMSITRAGDHLETWKPIGVSVVDTASWSVRTVDPDASGFTRTPTGLIILRNGTLTGYDLDGRTRFTVSFDEPVDYVQAVGGYVYAWGHARTTTIVDPSTGEVVARVPKPSLWLLGDRG
jgi:hypothetical protein